MRARICAVWVAAALAACGPRPKPEPNAPGPAGPVCRIGPDGGPVHAAVSDRGIGGTGIETVDRGIGGTGIIGVITGFASLCVNGLEVGLPADAPVLIDGAPAAAGQLRAGQLAVIAASGPDASLRAASVEVRHEVVGPVERTERDGLALVVAGQRIRAAAAAGTARPTAGAWVAVSGLRMPEGDIDATRIDPAPPGRVLVRGALEGFGSALRLGGVRRGGTARAAALSGRRVLATGRLAGSALVVDRLEADPIAEDPARAFGPETRRLSLEAYVPVLPGGILAAPGFQGGPAPARRGVTVLVRNPDGSFSAQSFERSPGPAGNGGPMRLAPGGAASPPGRGAGPDGFTPAPVPNPTVAPGAPGSGAGAAPGAGSPVAVPGSGGLRGAPSFGPSGAPGPGAGPAGGPGGRR